MPVVPHFREFPCVAIGLILLVVTQIALTKSQSLLSRDFWFDELFTQDLVSDPSLLHSFSALKAGAETHPPALYLVLRAFTLGGRFSNEVSLRFLALLFTLIALLGIYGSLRLSFCRLPSVTGCLAVWCHWLVLAQAFEARMYGPWLAGAVWYAYFLSRTRSSRSLLLGVILAGIAVFLCTVHYFGIITLGLVTATELLFRWLLGREMRISGLLPALLGPIALAACLPLLQSQRAAFTVSTWIEPPTLHLAKSFFTWLLLPTYLVLIFFVAWLSALWQSARRTKLPDRPWEDLTLQTGLTALALLPLVLIVFSFGVQSVLVTRYGLPAVAALAPMVAYVVSGTSRGWVLALCALLVLQSGNEIKALATRYRQRDEGTNQAIVAIRNLTSNAPVVFEDALTLLVVNRYAADLANRCYYLDFERTPVINANESRVFVRDLVRQRAHLYQSPLLIKWDDLGRFSNFYLVASSKVWLEEKPIEQMYPGFKARQIRDLSDIASINEPGWQRHLYEMTRRTRS